MGAEGGAVALPVSVAARAIALQVAARAAKGRTGGGGRGWAPPQGGHEGGAIGKNVAFWGSSKF